MENECFGTAIMLSSAKWLMGRKIDEYRDHAGLDYGHSSDPHTDALLDKLRGLRLSDEIGLYDTTNHGLFDLSAAVPGLGACVGNQRLAALREIINRYVQIARSSCSYEECFTDGQAIRRIFDCVQSIRFARACASMPRPMSSTVSLADVDATLPSTKQCLSLFDQWLTTQNCRPFDLRFFGLFDLRMEVPVPRSSPAAAPDEAALEQVLEAFVVRMEAATYYEDIESSPEFEMILNLGSVLP